MSNGAGQYGGSMADASSDAATKARPKTSSSATGASITEPNVPDAPTDSRPIRRFLKGAWPLLLVGLPAWVTLLGLTFGLFPGPEPVTSPPVRSVAVTDLGLAERDRDLGDGRVANAVVFAVETAGDVADDIAVDWLVLDSQTKRHLPESPSPERWGVIDVDTETDRVVGEIIIAPPADHPGCVVVRVFLQPAAAVSAAADESTGRLLLDVADTTAFDPIDPFNPACPDSALPRI
jgi:hypothetical protein